MEIVEPIAEGERRETGAFLREVRERLSNHIRDEHRHVGPATGEFNSFEIRH